MLPKIIFESNQMLVLDKPAGWIVNEAETTGSQPVIQNWLKENFNYPISENRELRSGIVHRLDKETSGILLVAKTGEALENLQSQFKEREIKKIYTALVHGKLEPKSGEIKTSLGRLPWRRDRFGVLPGGRDSATEYKVLNFYRLMAAKKIELVYYSLVEFYPKTGRTHQIRIHAKYIHHPVVADEFYAGRKTAREDRKWCPRLFLHASGITFKDPGKLKDVSYSSGLPSELKNALDLLSEAV